MDEAVYRKRFEIFSVKISWLSPLSLVQLFASVIRIFQPKTFSLDLFLKKEFPQAAQATVNILRDLWTMLFAPFD